MYKSSAGANLISAFKVSSTSDHERRFAKNNYYLMAGRVGMASKSFFKLLFPILKVRYPAIS